MSSSTMIEIENGEITLNRSIAAELLRCRIDRKIADLPFAGMSEMAKNAAVEGGLSAIDTIIALAAHYYRAESEKADLLHSEKVKTGLARNIEAGKLQDAGERSRPGPYISFSLATPRSHENAGETE